MLFSSFWAFFQINFFFKIFLLSIQYIKFHCDIFVNVDQSFLFMFAFNYPSHFMGMAFKWRVGTPLATASPSLWMSLNLWADFPSLIVEVLPWVVLHVPPALSHSFCRIFHSLAFWERNVIFDYFWIKRTEGLRVVQLV